MHILNTLHVRLLFGTTLLVCHLTSQAYSLLYGFYFKEKMFGWRMSGMTVQHDESVFCGTDNLDKCVFIFSECGLHTLLVCQD